MNRFSTGALSLLGALTGHDATPHTTQGELRLISSPTLRKLEDPAEDLDAIATVIEEGLTNLPHPWLSQGRWRRSGAAVEDGTFDGRACCYARIRRYDQKLATLRLPVEFTCTCGARYVIEQAVRPRP